MSTWRCGWICPRSYFFTAVFLAAASFAVLLVGAFLAGVPEGYLSPPSSVWSRSVSAVSGAIAYPSSHFWTSPPRRSADRWAKSRAITAIAVKTFMARPLRWISAISAPSARLSSAHNADRCRRASANSRSSGPSSCGTRRATAGRRGCRSWAATRVPRMETETGLRVRSQATRDGKVIMTDQIRSDPPSTYLVYEEI